MSITFIRIVSITKYLFIIEIITICKTYWYIKCFLLSLNHHACQISKSYMYYIQSTIQFIFKIKVFLFLNKLKEKLIHGFYCN